ncbi:MAG: SDR family oxidoreductase [Gammaproteobacteria bacterium]|nr:SDR family oxidoreductase [Gammaproteobacteria bacterium]
MEQSKFLKTLREMKVFPDIKKPARISQLDLLFQKEVMSDNGIADKYVNYVGFCRLLQDVALIRYPPPVANQAIENGSVDGRSKGGDATFFKTDVACLPSIASLMQNSLLTYGPASILVHCAGINMPGGVLSLSEKEWDLTIKTNLTSTFYLTKEIFPQMRKISYGSIVLMSSVQGLAGFVESSAYAASKGGIISLTRQLARDFAGDRIRVNCISPGVIKTEIFDNIEGRDSMFAAVSDYTPLGHLGDPLDVAYACLYLGSDESSYITGVNLAVDGGMTMRSV